MNYILWQCIYRILQIIIYIYIVFEYEWVHFYEKIQDFQPWTPIDFTHVDGRGRWPWKCYRPLGNLDLLHRRFVGGFEISKFSNGKLRVFRCFSGAWRARRSSFASSSCTGGTAWVQMKTKQDWRRHIAWHGENFNITFTVFILY